jgi:hypothetical protein
VGGYSGWIVVLIFGLLTVWFKWPILVSGGAQTNWLLVSLILFVGGQAAIGPLRLIPRRHQRTQALEGALARGAITPELTASLNDQVVNTFRKVELVILVVIVILMVTKPF